jgi:epoxyqueuosine reductase QueG
MTAAELERVAEELELDVVGAAPASAYASTERHIEERKARGLFADMRFTMAQPEVSCHPETLLPGARTVVSAAHCYYAPEPPLEPGEGRLARYTWHDGYAVLRERLDELAEECRNMVDGRDEIGISRQKNQGAPIKLVVYPGEYHEFKAPSHLKDRLERYLAWYAHYVKADGTPARPAAAAKH